MQHAAREAPKSRRPASSRKIWIKWQYCFKKDFEATTTGTKKAIGNGYNTAQINQPSIERNCGDK
jgi:hypothetical protein